jgi:hypothetical protein
VLVIREMSEGKSKILYSCIADNGKIVVESGEEGYQDLIHALLREIKKSGEPGRKAYVHEELSFNYISTAENTVYIAVCNSSHFLLTSLLIVNRFVMNNFQHNQHLPFFNILKKI